MRNEFYREKNVWEDQIKDADDIGEIREREERALQAIRDGTMPREEMKGEL